MKRRKFSITLLSFAAIGYGCQERPTETSQSSPPDSGPSVGAFVFDVISFFSTNPFIRLLGALKIVIDGANLARLATYDQSTDSYKFPTNNPNVFGFLSKSENSQYIPFQTPAGTVKFSPSLFANENNLSLQNESEIQSLDLKILNDYSECTERALDTGESNFIKLLELRLSCLEMKGYSQNSQNYVRIKHERY